MEIRRLEIPDVVLIRPRRIPDGRGWFAETWNAREFAEAGIDVVFVQDNHSYSARAGTVRALHFQRPPHDQAKLVRVLAGAIFDVAVDLRRGSPTYGRHVTATLTAERGEELFIPTGFAHGFATLAPDTEVLYKVDKPYAAAFDSGLFWNDPELAIPWPVKPDVATVSEKDGKFPRLADFESPFTLPARPARTG
jgi:dTDP-4-dehydrorhamnose 3,5-epimerase